MQYSKEEIAEKLAEYLERNQHEQYRKVNLYITDDFQVFLNRQIAEAHAGQPANGSRCVYTWNVANKKLYLSYDAKKAEKKPIDKVMYYNRHFS